MKRVIHLGQYFLLPTLPNIAGHSLGWGEPDATTCSVAGSESAYKVPCWLRDLRVFQAAADRHTRFSVTAIWLKTVASRVVCSACIWIWASFRRRWRIG